MSEYFVGFCTTHWPLSAWIRSMTGSDISHCYLRRDNTILHADFKGVRTEPKGEFEAGHIMKYEFEILAPRIVQEQAWDSVTKLMGQKYGFGQLAAELWVLWKFKHGHVVKNPVRDGIICSELAYLWCYGLEWLAPYGLPVRDPNSVWPEQLKQDLLALKTVQRLR
jgi:hypothetical protein